MHTSTPFYSRRAARRALAPLPDTTGLAGALAGLGGGVAMMLIGALLDHALDQDRWLQLKVIGGLVLGPAMSAQAGFVAEPILAGALIQLAIAALLGVVFEMLMRRMAGRSPAYGLPEVAGLAYGVLIWLATFLAIIPTLVPLLLQIYAPALIIQQLIYGAVTGLLFSILRPQPYEQAL